MESTDTVPELQRELESLRERVRQIDELRGPRISDPFLRLSERAGSVGSFEWEFATGSVTWSREMYRIHGIDESRFSGQVSEYAAFVHEGDRERVNAIIEHLVKGGEPQSIEYRIVRPDGSVRHVLGSSLLITGNEGAIRLIGTVQDITVLKQVETALETTEERFRIAVDGSGGGLWDIGLDPETGAPLADRAYFSAHLKALLGFSESELSSNVEAWWERVHPDDRERFRGSLAAVIATPGRSSEVEYRVLHRDEGYRWFHSRGHVQRDRHGRPIRWTGIDWDITERKRRDELLAAVGAGIGGATGEGFFHAIVRALAESLGAAFAFVAELDPSDPDRSTTVAAFARGSPVDNFTYELGGTPCAEVIQKVKRLVPSGLRERYPNDTLAADLQADSYCGTALTDSSGRVLGLIVVADTGPFSEPTLVQSTLEIFASRASAELERRQNENRLRESEQRYRSLFLGSRDAIYISSRDGVMEDINPAGLALFGYTRSDLVQMQTTDLYADPAERTRFQDIIEHVGSVKDYPVVLQRADGSHIDCLMSSTVRVDEKGQVAGYQGIIRDVTERRRMEASLRANEHRLRVITEQVPGIVWTTDRELRVRSLLGGARQALGISESDVIGAPISQLFADPEEGISPAAAHRSVLGGTSESYEVRFGDREYECVVQPLRGASGQVDGIIGVGLDTTAHRRMERALAVQEAYFANLFEHSPDAIVILDSEFRIQRVNGAFTEMFGYSVDECRGTKNLVVPENQIPESTAISQELLEGRSVSMEVVRRAKDGSLLDVSILASPILRSGTLVGVYGSYRDISERRRAAMLVRESRERLRNLAARLHEVREEERALISREIHDELGQALTAIKMDVAWVKARLAPEAGSVAERCRSIDELLGRTIDVVRNITGRLRPALLDDLGLGAAVEWQTQEFASRAGLDHECLVPENDVRLEPGRATSVFRILQEALTNVARHGGATKFSTRLEVDDAAIRLTIDDDGRGVTDEEIESTQSLGIIGMRERAGAFGGRVSIGRRPEGGTRVAVVVPRRSRGLKGEVA